MPNRVHTAFFIGVLFFSNLASARLEVCNQTDLVLMVAVGYDTTEERIASEGWWRIYPGFCEVPVDVTFLSGFYYIHAESNPSSTMPDDAYSYGEDKALCVKTEAEFRLTNASYCSEEDIVVSFDTVSKNWRNSNTVELTHESREYDDLFASKVAGVQRMLSILGYDIDEIDGVAGEQTVDVLNKIALDNNVFALDFKRVYSLLEQLIVEKQRLVD